MKAQIKLLIIIFLLLGTMNSCTKFGKNVTIEGRVINPVTGEGISGVKIVLEKETLEIPGGIKSIKEVYTDANGSFELNKFSFRASQITANTGTAGDYYKIGWHKDGEYVSINSTLEIKKGKKLNVDFHMVPYGELQIRIKNTACFDAFDKVKIYFDGESDESRTFNPGLLYEKVGCMDVLDSKVKTTMGYKYFHWISIKNNITTTYYDTVFVGENTVSTISVFY